MTALRNAIDRTALGWVKPELDALLGQARIEVEAWAADPADKATLTTCADLLQQVRGSLEMLALPASALLAEELRLLALATRDGATTDADAAGAVLMRGLVQLPDYLERLQGGHRDVPEALGPLLDKVRAARGHDALQLQMLRDLGDGQPATEAELAHARAALGGRNRELLRTVSAAVKEELMQVKDALDLHLRAAHRSADDLQPHAVALGRIADTLDMIGLGAASQRIARERDVLRAIAGGSRPASEDALLDIAGTLLRVDASLDEQVERMGEADGGDDLAASESRQVTAVLLREAGANMAQVREAVTASIMDGWHPDVAADAPRLLHEVAGALRMLDQEHPADLATGLQGYLQAGMGAGETAPSAVDLDRLADAVSSLEMYLEGLNEGIRREDLLDITRSSLAMLGHWPLRQAAAKATFEERTGHDEEDVAVAAEAPPPAPVDVQPAAPVAIAAAAVPQVGVGQGVVAGFDQAGADIDDDIREVFLEEFEEEIGNLGSLLPEWRADPDNLDRLHPVRRVFHTLKGSGRLVGARVLGEFSWKIENMLNRVRDGQRPATPAVIAVVEQAAAALPQLHAALRGEPAPLVVDLDALQQVADRVAAGEEVRLAPASAPAAPQAPAQAAPEASADAGVAAEHADPEAGVPAAPASLDPASMDTEAQAAPEEIDADVAAAPEGIEVSIDSVLLEILDAEVTGHVETVQHWLEVAAPQVDESLMRALHTSNGAFAMAEVPAITDVLGTAETYVKRLHASAEPASAEGVAAIAATAGAMASTLQSLRGPVSRVKPAPELAAHLRTLRDALPEPAQHDYAAMETDDLDVLGIAGAPVPDAPVLADQLAEERAEAEREAALQAEADLLEAERLAFERAEAERAEAERLEAERVEVERLEAERLEAERLEVERLEAERLEAERLEAERLEAERLEAERLEAERLEAERLEAERLEAERLEAERLEAERLEAERLEAERLEAERLEAERLEAERLEAERLEAERLEADRLETERTEAERLEAERLEAERLEAERLEAERLEAERLEAERLEAERLEAERLEAERLEAERLEAERLEAERLEAERLEAERLEAERLEAERLEAERLEAERVEAERVEAERRQAEAEARRIEAERVAAEQAEARRVAEEQAAAEREARKREAEAARIAAFVASAASAAAAEDPDEALDLSGLDPELLDIFTEEAGDLLDHSDGLLAQLREAPESRDIIAGLQRDLHTLKGGARMAGVMAIGELGHAMESLLEVAAAQRVELGRRDVPLLERGFDRLHGMVVRVGARRAIGLPEALISEFDARARGEGIASEKVELKPLSAPIGAGLGDEDDDITVRAPQEQVRIRADLLDRLVNYAGEVAIYRARLEQQLGAFRSAMFEMEQTNARLRDQLRRLDSETEAQIIARYQREHAVMGQDGSDPTFDPLELDRFSTLQQLSRALGESAADMSSLQGTLDDLTRQYETLLLQQSRVSSDLQEGLMRTRMVPFDGLVPRLRRVVRQAAGDTGKNVQLKLEGAQGELDRNVLERMTAPLEHMLRNAVAHGLESPEGRRAAGKEEEGTVRIAVRREGSEVVLEVADDGAGLDRAAIRRRGLERGLIHEGTVLADSDLDALIMEPGFSTADEVSRLAGRGVGMDVVASEVRQLGGTLDITSTVGNGTTFLLRLPQTLAVTQAVFVRIGETSFAVPIASVRGVGRISREELSTPGATYRYGGEDYALHDMGRLLGQPPARAEGQVQMPLLLIRSGELRAAVSIDHVLGNREIVVKPVGPQVASVPGIFGATIMGDGSVVVILDVAPLVRRSAALPREVAVSTQPEQRRVPLVMVVDDSVTMRKVTGRVLERHNYEVVTAKDGVDALERMDERVPDLMLLDIEMPRMDGYELATQMRADARLRGVPIIMITSRTGEKHRQRALEIGVQRYLGKPYQEPELMRNVFDLLGTGPVTPNAD